MNPTTIKGAIRRSADLNQVGHDQEALDVLHRFLSANSRRLKYSPNEEVEELILKHLQLSVKLRKQRMAKEALMQYRTFAQINYVQALDSMIKTYRSFSERKLEQVKANARQINLDLGAVSGKLKQQGSGGDDDDSYQTNPDMLLGAAVSNDVQMHGERDMRNWLRFQWESYRNILDILKQSSALEDTYHETAAKAANFCTTIRANEFRRLNDQIRLHHNQLRRNTKVVPHYVNPLSPETISKQFDTRTLLLKTAIQLNLWKDAFQIAEGLQEFMRRKQLTSPQYEEYYLNLSKMFWVGRGDDDFLFHAFAATKHLNLAKQRSITPEEVCNLSSNVVLAALCIPPISSQDISQNDPNLLSSTGNVNILSHLQDKNKRISQILSRNVVPTKKSVNYEIVNQNILKDAHPFVLDLYKIMERDYSPLTICRDAGPILKKILEVSQLAMDEAKTKVDLTSSTTNTSSLGIMEQVPAADVKAAALAKLENDQSNLVSDDDMSVLNIGKYVPQLKRMVIARLIMQMSKIYSEVTIKEFLRLCYNLVPDSVAEKWLHTFAKRGFISSGIKSDAIKGTITFVPDYALEQNKTGCYIEPFSTSDLTSYRERFVFVEDRFNYAMAKLASFKPEAMTKSIQQTRDALSKTLEDQVKSAKLESDRRKCEIQRRRAIVEDAIKNAEEDRVAKQQQSEAEEKRAEKLKMEADNKQRELDRLEKDRQQKETERKKKLLEAMQKTAGGESIGQAKVKIEGQMKAVKALDNEDLAKVNREMLEDARNSQIQKERMDKIKTRKMEIKRVDHFARALREEEKPEIIRWGEQVKDKDASFFADLNRRTKEQEAEDYHAKVADKSLVDSLKRFKSDWDCSENKGELSRTRLETTQTFGKEALESYLKEKLDAALSTIRSELTGDEDSKE